MVHVVVVVVEVPVVRVVAIVLGRTPEVGVVAGIVVIAIVVAVARGQNRKAVGIQGRQLLVGYAKRQTLLNAQADLQSQILYSSCFTRKLNMVRVCRRTQIGILPWTLAQRTPALTDS